MVDAEYASFFPGRAPIDAYGNGGFRFADMSHRGSLLCLPSGVYAWDAVAADSLSIRSFEQVLAERERFSVLLLGTGASQVFPSVELRKAFIDAGLALEPMDTGAACRTYNVLLGEGRSVAAALLAVE